MITRFDFLSILYQKLLQPFSIVQYKLLLILQKLHKQSQNIYQD